MAHKPQIYTIYGLSLELGRDRSKLTSVLRTVEPDGTTIHGHPGWYLRTAIAALASDLGDFDPAHERARLYAAQADLAEHALAKKRAELVPVDQVAVAWAAITSAICDRVSMIPATAAAGIDPSRPVAEIEGQIRRAIDAALADISGAEIIACDEPTSNQP